MRFPTTHNYTCTVAVTTWRQPLYNSSDASLMSANRLKLNADKTELLWAGSRRCCITLGSRGPKLQLVPTNDVKVLGMTLSSDLTMDKHVSNVCSARFYRLRQLRRVRRSFIWTRCRLQPSCTPLSRPASITVMYCWLGHRRLQLTSYTASFECCSTSSQSLSGTKFDRGLSRVMHVDLYWLDVPGRVKYKLVTMVYNCLHDKAPS